MKKSAAAWSLVGVLAGLGGLATSYLVSQLMNLRLNPVTAVAEQVRDRTPAGVVNWARENDGKAITVPAIVILLILLFAGLGLLARRAWWMPVTGFGVLAAVGAVAMLGANGATVGWLLPVAVGFATMTTALAVLSERLRRLQALPDDQVFGEAWRGRRRDFLVIAGAVAAAAGLSGVLARLAGRDVREVQQERQTPLRTVSSPVLPDGAQVDAVGARPWMTPVAEFYLIDTAFTKPAIPFRDWSLRIHGMVENEITLTYEDLFERGLSESWVTLNCVSNEVGGELVGNAWFSGTLLGPILAEAKPTGGADAILQTSSDGWTCGTPLATVMDGRDAMLAVAMNGEQLTIEHGYPVRVVVPGLYGYVSATKWVVDMEVTTFDAFDAYWTQNGWGEFGPVKMASRIEVPESGADVAAGEVVIAGAAWSQHIGIAAVDVQVDGGAWTAAELATTPSEDTWVQWKVALDLAPGAHRVFVRATDKDGLEQTSARADVLPDGATGWHSIEFTAS